MISKKVIASALFTLIAGSVASSHGATVTFNAGTELAGQFYSSALEINATNAVGGTGNAVRPTGDGQAVYTAETFALGGAGDKITTSVMVYKSGNATGNSYLATVGFGSTAPANGGLFTTAGMDMVSVRLASTTGTSDYQLQYQYRTPSLVGPTNLFASAFTLTNGYYLLSLTSELTDPAAGKFKLSGSVVSYGTDGLTAGSTIRSFSDVNITNAGIVDNLGTLYAGIRASNSAAGVVRLDNFSANVVTTAVPEPTAAMTMIGATGLALLRRGRLANKASA